MFLEGHDRAVFAVNIDRFVAVGVHGHAAHGADIGKRKNIGNGVFVEPDLAKVWKISDFGRILVAPVSNGPQGAATVTDVGEHVWVIENRDRALRIEEYPVRINLVFVLGKHEGVLKEGRAGGRTGGGTGGGVGRLAGGCSGGAVGLRVGGMGRLGAFLCIMSQ